MFSKALQEEQLGLAHLFTMASKSRLICEIPKVDIDSVDVLIRAVDIDGDDILTTKPNLDIQLKSTINLNTHTEDENCFYFDLNRKNYDDLRDPKVAIPRILVFYHLPADNNLWVEHTEDQLITRKCAYWCSIRGEPSTTNTTSVRIKIPKRNILSPDKLRDILVHIAKNGKVNPNDII